MTTHLRAAILSLIILTIITGLLYPLAVTGVAQLLFPQQANGSLIVRRGAVVGSSLVGQPFSGPGYFHPRPSLAGKGYDAMASGGSNLGPLSRDLVEAVGRRVAEYREENGLASGTAVPADAVTASASGLDPDISPENARLQAGRVARARGLPEPQVLALVADSTRGRTFGVLGEPRVNVLELNLALDGAARAGR